MAALLMLLCPTATFATPPTETGIASWYGPGFEGKKTSNGETFTGQQMTAAHNTLPLGSRVRVTNLKTHKSAVLKINDRGSFGCKYRRLIDVSKKAAEQLDLQQDGIARVQVDVLSIAQPAPSKSSLKPTRISYPGCKR